MVRRTDRIRDDVQAFDGKAFIYERQILDVRDKSMARLVDSQYLRGLPILIHVLPRAWSHVRLYIGSHEIIQAALAYVCLAQNAKECGECKTARRISSDAPLLKWNWYQPGLPLRE